MYAEVTHVGGNPKNLKGVAAKPGHAPAQSCFGQTADI